MWNMLHNGELNLNTLWIAFSFISELSIEIIIANFALSLGLKASLAEETEEPGGEADASEVWACHPMSAVQEAEVHLWWLHVADQVSLVQMFLLCIYIDYNDNNLLEVKMLKYW